MDQLPDGYLETDAEGRIAFMNKSLAKDLGLEEEGQLTGRLFSDLVQKKYRQGIAQRFNNIVEGNESFEHFQVVFSRQGGTRVVGDASLSPVVSKGRVVACKCLVRNITDSVEADKEKAFEKDFLDALLQQAPLAIAVLDKARKLSVVNPAFLNYFEAEQEKTAGKQLEFYLKAPELMQKITDYLDGATQDPFYGTGQRKRNDGSLRDVEVFVQSFFAGSIKYGHLVFMNDISEQRKAEAELVSTTKAYRAVLDKLHDAYYEADMAGYLSFVNQRFADAVRYDSKEKLIGMHFRHLVERSSRRKFFQEYKQVFEPRKAVKPIALRYLTTDGLEFVSELVASPIYADGKAVGSRGIIRDISIRVKAEERLRAAKEEAERDLEIGREIQQGFFPRKLPDIPGWEIATRFKAARQVSGDFYDAFPVAEGGCHVVVIADVCDKGVGAALFMVLLRSLLRSSSEHYPAGTPAASMLHEIIHKVNNYVVQNHGQSNMFATLVLGVLDHQEHLLHYVNAGHDAPLLIGSHGMVRERLEPTGPALGFTADLPFELALISFMPGDMLLAYTDGIAEAKSPHGDFFTEERLAKVASRPWPSAFSAVRQIEARVFNHMGGQVQFDDLTMLALRRKQEDERTCHTFMQKAAMEHLSDFKAFAEEAAALLILEEETRQSIKLAVDEVCTNLITYGYADRDPGNIHLSICQHKEQLEIKLEDQGRTFDPSQAPAPDWSEDIEKRKIGGLGLFLVHELMDEVSYESHEGTNTLRLCMNKINKG